MELPLPPLSPLPLIRETTQAPKRVKAKSRKAPQVENNPNPLAVQVQFKHETLKCAEVRAHLVIETITHSLFMHEQLPWPWPKVLKWMHMVEEEDMSSEKGRKKRLPKSERQLLKTAQNLQNLFESLRGLFTHQKKYDVRQVAIVFGPSLRRSLWAVVLDFPTSRSPSLSGNMQEEEGSATTSGSSGLSQAQVLEACGRRLKRSLLEAAVSEPRPGSKSATKLHVLFLASQQGLPGTANAGASAGYAAAHQGIAALRPLLSSGTTNSPLSALSSLSAPAATPPLLLLAELHASRLPTELASLPAPSTPHHPPSSRQQQNAAAAAAAAVAGLCPRSAAASQRQKRCRGKSAWPQQPWLLNVSGRVSSPPVHSGAKMLPPHPFCEPTSPHSGIQTFVTENGPAQAISSSPFYKSPNTPIKVFSPAQNQMADNDSEPSEEDSEDENESTSDSNSTCSAGYMDQQEEEVTHSSHSGQTNFESPSALLKPLALLGSDTLGFPLPDVSRNPPSGRFDLEPAYQWHYFHRQVVQGAKL
jgi:hypothetical protein